MRTLSGDHVSLVLSATVALHTNLSDTLVFENEAATLDRLRERLRLFAARRLRNWAEAEDVVQEALRRAIEAEEAGKIQNLAALPAFLFQTVVHICQHRSLSAGREAKALKVMAFQPPAPADESADPLESMITEEQRRNVLRAMERLGAGDRELLDLSYADALDAAEIGRRLGLSPGNVRVRRHRALRRLCELMDVTPEPERGLKR